MAVQRDAGLGVREVELSGVVCGATWVVRPLGGGQRVRIEVRDGKDIGDAQEHLRWVGVVLRAKDSQGNAGEAAQVAVQDAVVK